VQFVPNTLLKSERCLLLVFVQTLSSLGILEALEILLVNACLYSITRVYIGGLDSCMDSLLVNLCMLLYRHFAPFTPIDCIRNTILVCIKKI